MFGYSEAPQPIWRIGDVRSILASTARTAWSVPGTRALPMSCRSWTELHYEIRKPASRCSWAIA